MKRPSFTIIALIAAIIAVTARAGCAAEGSSTESELRRALATAETESGLDSAAVADALDRLVTAALESDTAPTVECRGWAERATTIRARTAGPASIEFANSLYSEAKLAFRQVRYADGEQLYDRAARLFEQIQGPNGIELAAVLNDRALCLQLLARFDEAEPLYRRALAIRTERLGPDHSDTAGSINNLAALARHRGEYAEAIALYGDALTRFEHAEGADGVHVGTVLNNIAVCQQFLGDYEAAETALRRSLAIREQRYGPDHTSVATALSNLASVLDDMARFAEARPLFERALAITEKQQGISHPRLALLLNTLAVMLRHMGDLDEAERTYRRALTIAETGWGADNPETSRVRFNLAVLLQERGDHRGAIELLTQVQAAQEKVLGLDHPDLGATLHTLGVSRRETGDLMSARALLQRALQIREAKLGTNHPMTAATLSELATLDERAANTAEAERQLQRALTILSQSLGEKHPQVATAWRRLGLFHARFGDSSRALDEALRAEAIGRDHFQLTVESLAEDRALLWMQARPSAVDLLLSITAHRPVTKLEPVWNAVMEARGAVYEELAARRRALTATNAGDARRLRTALQTTTTRLSRLLVRGPGTLSAERYTAIVSAAATARDAAEEALASSTLAYRRKREREQADVMAIGKALPANGALVAFVEFDDVTATAAGRRYAAFTLRAGRTPEWHLLGDAAEIDARISRWRREAGTPPGADRLAETRYRDIATQLRRIVWDPLARDIEGAALILIVPAGNLHLVNFATLPRDDGSYLVEAGAPIQYLATERDVLGFGPVRSGRSLLAVGGVNYNSATTRAANDRPAIASADTMESLRSVPEPCRNFAAMQFPALPGAQREVDDIALLWRRSHRSDSAPVVLTGDAATEGAFKRLVPGKRFVHLATHGYFLKGACEPLPRTRGVGELVAADEPLAQGQPAEWTPPALGLALAGVNQRPGHSGLDEDGIVTAEELSALDFSNAEWVVLSACNTGVGDVLSGEGVLGLQRALQIAGARSVVMSLWPVRDDDARAWMNALYRAHLVEHKPTATSAAAAALDLLQTRRAKRLDTHPFHWGAFVAAGDWR